MCHFGRARYHGVAGHPAGVCGMASCRVQSPIDGVLPVPYQTTQTDSPRAHRRSSRRPEGLPNRGSRRPLRVRPPGAGCPSETASSGNRVRAIAKECPVRPKRGESCRATTANETASRHANGVRHFPICEGSRGIRPRAGKIDVMSPEDLATPTVVLSLRRQDIPSAERRDYSSARAATMSQFRLREEFDGGLHGNDCWCRFCRQTVEQLICHRLLGTGAPTTGGILFHPCSGPASRAIN